MKINKFTRKISIIVLILISFYVGYRAINGGIYIKSLIDWNIKKKQIDENFNKQHRRFEIIDTIYIYLNNNDFGGLKVFMDSIIDLDSNNLSLRIKRGFVNYKLGDYKEAQRDFQQAYDNSYTMLGDTLIINNEYKYRHSLIGLRISNYLLAPNDTNKLLLLRLYNTDLFLIELQL